MDHSTQPLGIRRGAGCSIIPRQYRLLHQLYCQVNHSSSIMSVQEEPSPAAPMESISSQYDNSGSMTMWETLVHVASQRYEELLEEERRKKERQQQESEITADAQCEADQQSLDQSAPLIRSAEISIAENITVGGDDEEDPGRLVIDESSVEVPNEDAVVDQVVPDTTGTEEQEQPIQQPRETVIQPCRSNGVNGEVGHDVAEVPDQECRTPEQQAIREKNTIAARQSRAKMRLMDELLQQEANNEKTHNYYMKERMAGIFTYANALRDNIGLEEEDFLEEFERVKQNYVPGPMRSHYVRSRLRSVQDNGESGQSSPFDLNGNASSSGESDITLNEKSNGSETDTAPEADGTVLDLSVKSKRDRS